MAYTEAYREHIMYTFHGFCKVVIRHAAITAWRDQQRRHKREISLEYLTEEKFYPLGTTDEYFTAPYEEYPIIFWNFSHKKYSQIQPLGAFFQIRIYATNHLFN